MSLALQRLYFNTIRLWEVGEKSNMDSVCKAVMCNGHSWELKIPHPENH